MFETHGGQDTDFSFRQAIPLGLLGKSSAMLADPPSSLRIA
jgi:hypothetical protein